MKEKILVLDDEALILTSLEHLLEDDYEVFPASSAVTALRLTQEHDIAVILCDERMPEVRGHQFLRRVKEVSRATRIIMSGYADMGALTEAVNSGQIFAYIAKPWEPPELKAQLAVAVSHFKLVQEVAHERELLRALMENIPDLIFFKDGRLRFTRVNHAHAQVLGAKNAAECIGKSDADYFESGYASRWRLEEEQMVRLGRPEIDRIEQLRSPRGGLGWWSTTKVPMFDRGGRVSGIAGISRDITALKNSEEKLREQSEHNRMILQTARDAFIAMDSGGSIKAWNPQAERTFGWAAAEAMGRRLSDIAIAPAHRAAHAQGVEHFLASARAMLPNQAIEFVAVHRDGHEFPVEATIWPVQVGGVLSYNAFVRDISRRRRAEEGRKKEAALVQLLQAVTVAANRSSTIEDAAQVCLDQICSHLGWPVGHAYMRANNSSEELISTGLWDLEEEARFEAFRAASDGWRFVAGAGFRGRILGSGRPEWIVDLNDSERFLRAEVAAQAGLRSGFGFPLLVEEEIVGILEFFSVETAQPDEELLSILGSVGSQLGQVIIRQRVEEELERAKASAEAANRAKSQFLTTMSHEMRNPMNAILGMADLLAESSLAEDQRGYVRGFQEAGANLLFLINDILDLSKVESGHIELESIAFELVPLLERIIALMMVRARERGLLLTLELLPGVPARVVGDPNRVRQILVNLIGNALKFTEQGSITLRVERDSAGEGGWLRFSVVDTGIGISAEKTEMIFGRFTQADSSTTRKYGGTGLGLAISKGLAELAGGRISCSSELGKGSTFCFTAPFGIAQAEKTKVEQTTAVEPAGIAIPPVGRTSQQPVARILIVEDSSLNVMLIKAYLKDCGFEIDVAENGQVAIERVKAFHPHLVLMDRQMPVMDGIQATRAIRRWETETGARPVPILALTADAMEEGAGSSLEAGSTEHLTKPVKKAILLEAIARNLHVQSLVPDYLTTVRGGVDQILNAADSNDCAMARQFGHQLKGPGEGFGFPEITQAGAALELAAEDANEEEIRRQILALATYLDRVEVAVP